MKFTVRARNDGSIGIPVAYRHRLGIQPGTIVTINTDPQGRIYLKPEKATCGCCHQQVSSVSVVTGMCPACETLVELYVRDGMDMRHAMRKARYSGQDDKH